VFVFVFPRLERRGAFYGRAFFRHSSSGNLAMLARQCSLVEIV
jgi:hypothetical protein